MVIDRSFADGEKVVYKVCTQFLFPLLNFSGYLIYLILSYLILSYLILSYLILSYLIGKGPHEGPSL